MKTIYKKRKPLKTITNNSKKENHKKQNLTDMEILVYEYHCLLDKKDITSHRDLSDRVYRYFKMIDLGFEFIENEITWDARSFMVDWIIKIHFKLGLAHDTLYLTIHITDRFLCVRNIPVNKLQLVAISALIIACKMEEVICPTLQNLVRLSESCMTPDDVKKAEKYMLHALNYNIVYSSPLNFLRICSKANNHEKLSKSVAKYLLELTYLYKEFTKYSGSVKSSTAMYLGRKITKEDGNKNLFSLYSGHTNEEMKDCFTNIIKIVAGPIPFNGIQSKYSSDKYMKAAEVVKEYAFKNFFQ